MLTYTLTKIVWYKTCFEAPNCLSTQVELCILLNSLNANRINLLQTNFPSHRFWQHSTFFYGQRNCYSFCCKAQILCKITSSNDPNREERFFKSIDLFFSTKVERSPSCWIFFVFTKITIFRCVLTRVLFDVCVLMFLFTFPCTFKHLIPFFGGPCSWKLRLTSTNSAESV